MTFLVSYFINLISNVNFNFTGELFMKICSLLPSATEMVCALGLSDSLVGISHACDYPESIPNAVVVTETMSNMRNNSSLGIDSLIKANRFNNRPTQMVNADLLKQIQPDIIITQDLCYVCAVEYGSVCEVTSDVLGYEPNILSFRPASVADIFKNIMTVAEACKIENEGKELVTSLSNRIDYIVDNLAVKYKEPTPTTFCIDWLDPLRNTGQWIPELIELAGGIEGLAEKHGKSREVSWGEVINYDPGYIFSMPCAFTMDRVKVDTVEVFSKVKDFESLQAFQNHNIYLFDGQLPSRHGPRIIDVLEGFAEILHPELFQGLSPSSLYEPCFF